MADFNENIRGISDAFEEAYSGWINHPDLKDEAKRRGAMECVEQAENALAADDRAFGAALEEERDRLTGYLEAGRQHYGYKPGPDSVASMLGAKAAVDSGDAAVINEAYDDALRRGDEAALTILERSGPNAMPADGLRDQFKERVAAAKEDRKHPVIKEREADLRAFEERAQKAEYARAMMRSNIVQRIRSRKGPGA